MDKKSISIITPFPESKKAGIDKKLQEELLDFHKKIIVLDDDPTGVQTVHDISVYTDWSTDSIRAGFKEERPLFYILTNSRGFTREETTKCHQEIAERVAGIAKETGKEFIIISRGDSTLRGHYPLETDIITQRLEEHNMPIRAEILCPFFLEGGRYTVDDVHYVRYGDEMIPAGETEFAKDATFGYHSSDLKVYIQEKTNQSIKKEAVVSISIENIRNLNLDEIEYAIENAPKHGKIILNAVDLYDLKVCAVAIHRAMKKGYYFVFRTAASFVKVIANIPDQPLLTRDKMVQNQKMHERGGIIVVGSHTEKTTRQLKQLLTLPKTKAIEMNSDLVLEDGKLELETKRIIKEAQEYIEQGFTPVVFTKRTLLQLENDTKEAALLRSVRISEAVQSVVGEISVTPAFVIAKGGITSSDVGVRALRVKRAEVLGQAAPGIPVWQTGKESRFPGIPYVIFPGNVGEEQTLKDVANVLMEQDNRE